MTNNHNHNGNKKPPPRRVPSDDFVLTVAGTEYHPHAGEWVEFRPQVPVGLLRAANRIRGINTALDELKDDTGAIVGANMARARAVWDGHYADLCDFLAQCVTAWDWTDDSGCPFSPPDGTDGPLNVLSDDELYYLMRAAQGQNPAALGNA